MLHRERKRLRDMEKERNLTSVGTLSFDMNVGSGPPAPPLALYSHSVCFSNPPHTPHTHTTPNITVSLSFSVGSHKDTNAGQSDPKQMRKEDPSEGTIPEEPFFQTKHKSNNLRLVTPMNDFQARLGLSEIDFLFFLSLKSTLLQSPSSYLVYCTKDFGQLDFRWASSISPECS